MSVPQVRPHGDMTKEQIDLIKSTVAKNATDEELKLFLYRCKNMGLDPLKPGQVHFVKYGNNPGTMIVGLDGFRSRAQASGMVAGVQREVVRDSEGRCIGAWCEVRRKDWTHPAREEVSLAEYTTGKAMWARMPETMIKKVAEVAALRMAFPDQLGGLYSAEEMEQAEVVNTTAKPVIETQPTKTQSAPNHVPATKTQIKTISNLIKERSISGEVLQKFISSCYPGTTSANMKHSEAEEITQLLEDVETSEATLMAYAARAERDKPGYVQQ